MKQPKELWTVEMLISPYSFGSLYLSDAEFKEI
jgi:hypothetical protein